MPAPHVIAHRGASADAPENTLPAFQRALELGVDGVELDVQLSRDGVLVVFHDATLDAKTDRTGRVCDHSARELQGADIGSWFDRERARSGAGSRYAGTGLATLDQVLGRFGTRLAYQVEIKSPEPELPALLLESVRARGVEGRTTVTSFDASSLARVRALDAGIPLCLLLDRRSRLDLGAESPVEVQRGWVERAARERFDQIGIAAEDLAPEVVAQVGKCGLSVRVWRIRNDADVERAIGIGCVGFTTDWPARALEIRARATDPPGP